jgi:5-methylcytosine-specific restriction endonuclease McrA
MNCRNCEKPLIANAIGRKKQCCSTACSDSFYRKNNPEKVAINAERASQRQKDLRVERLASLPIKSCVICSSVIAPKSVNMGKKCCSKACKMHLDGKIRRESGKLKVVNMTPEARDRKNANNRAWQPKLHARQCAVCKETQMVRAEHARSRPICLACSPLWSGIKPSPSTDLAKPSRPRFRIPQAIAGGEFFKCTCIECGVTSWSRYQFKYCGSRCKGKAKGGSEWITKARRLAIYERDNHTCQICMEDVDTGHDWTRDGWSPDGATLDHMVPRSLGGSDTASNLRLAHALCNSLRGAPVLT